MNLFKYWLQVIVAFCVVVAMTHFLINEWLKYFDIREINLFHAAALFVVPFTFINFYRTALKPKE